MSKKLYSLFEGAFAEITVDEENKIIRNVALVGQESKNKRSYPASTLKAAVSLYEGAKVFVNHPDDDDDKRGCRSVKDLAGMVENARFDGSKLRGDLNLLDNSGGNLIFEIATKMPKIAGMSHNAFGECRKEGDMEIVESIEKVVSVDLVTDPATNEGMYESKLTNKGDSEMKYEEVTMVGLKEARKDLVDSLKKEGQKSRDGEFEKVIKENEALKTKNTEFEKKLDEMKVKESLATKESTIDKMLDESKLPDEAKTDIFKETLKTLTVGKDEKLADKITEQINDRLDAIAGKKGVKNNSERRPTGESNDSSASEVAESLKEDTDQ